MNESDNAFALRQTLVEYLKSKGHIRTERVEAAFRAVPRHLFVPSIPVEQAYRDEAFITKRIDGVPASSSSQPAIMAIMLEQLGLEAGRRVLEIGAGTGYNAALMAHIVGETGEIVTMDIDEEIVEGASEHLAAAGYSQVKHVCGDGGFGFPSAAPYDRIILTVGSGEIVPAWREQLESGGRLLLPLTIKGPQVSVAFEPAADHLASVSVTGCGFMMLRGAFAEPRTSIRLGPEPSVWLLTSKHDLIDAEAGYRLLTGPSRDLPTGLRSLQGENWGGLGLWLALRESEICGLLAEGKPAERGRLPALVTWGGSQGKSCFTTGLLGSEDLNLLLALAPEECAPTENSEDTFSELFVRNYGSGESDALAQRLIEQVRAWDAAGCPAAECLRIRAYPQHVDYVPSPSETVVEKRWTRLVLDWKMGGDGSCWTET